MSETPEIAWRVLRIVALALPAYAIFLQVFVRLNPPEISDVARQYAASFIALIIMGPMAIAGVISTFVIYRSIHGELIAYSVALLSVSFIVTPIVLVYIWQSSKRLFESEFSVEKKSPREATEQLTQKYPRLTLFTYLFGLGIGIIFVVSSWGIWWNILGVVQILLSVLSIITHFAPELELDGD